PRIASLQPNALAGTGIESVAQRDFKHLRQVEVTGKDIGFLAKCPRLHAAGGSTGAGVFNRLPLPQQFLHHQVGVEDRGLSPTFADNLDAAFEEALRALLAQLQVRRRLMQPYFVDHLEDQVRELVDAIRAIRFEASVVDVGKVGVSAALRSRHANLGRRGLIIEFHPKTFEQFFGPVTRERSVGKTLLVKGVKMLVQPPWAEGVPRIQFADY